MLWEISASFRSYVATRVDKTFRTKGHSLSTKHPSRSLLQAQLKRAFSALLAPGTFPS